MGSKTKLMLSLILVAAVLFGAYFAYQALAGNANQIGASNPSNQETTQSTTKIPAPDFTVYDDNGNKVKLSDFKNKPIVLNFWASWCPPCKIEMPHFNEVYAEMKDDVVFLMVDMVDGQRETQAKGKQYVIDQGYSFPVYFDLDQDAAYTYGISSIPTTLVINADGDIITGFQGAIDAEKLKAAIALVTQ